MVFYEFKRKCKDAIVQINGSLYGQLGYFYYLDKGALKYPIS